MDKKMDTDMFIKALDMAYENRTPDPGVIVHSDNAIRNSIMYSHLKNRLNGS